MLRRLLGLRRRSKQAALPRRLEEAIAYFAGRTNPHHYARSAYLGDHTALALLEGRLPIYLDTRGTDVAPHIMMFGIWEQNYTRLFQRLVQPGDTVLDLGAQLGVYTLLACASAGPSGRVHGFEPNPRFASLLQRSLAVNGFAGFATAHNLAVGAAEGRTELFFNWEYAGGGHLATTSVPAPSGGERASCRVVALDELFPDPDFTVDVVKMDIEGSETFALQGMQNLLRRSPQVRVMFEFAPGMLAGHGSSAADLIGLFAGLGFRFWEIAADSSLLPVAAAELAEQREGVVNILASREDPKVA